VSPPPADEHRADVLAALELAEQLLDPESTKRIGPRAALRHRFLADGDDEAHAPQRLGKGVCGHLHFVDASGAPGVRVRVMRGGREVTVERRIAPGQGIAYGDAPCEFHTEDVP
jgi:cell division control protein 7